MCAFMLQKIGGGQGKQKYQPANSELARKGVKCTNVPNLFYVVPFHKGEYFQRYHTFNQY
jgi:cation diffusion facilitator CzcD-associated flavoprotein CzcO